MRRFGPVLCAASLVVICSTTALVVVGCATSSGDQPDAGVGGSGGDGSGGGGAGGGVGGGATCCNSGAGHDAAAPGDGAPADAGTDGAAHCTGKSGMRRGLTNRSLMVAGANRTYLVYLPMNVSENQALALVFVHHGFTMSGQAMHDITLYSNLADKEGIAVVFPDGEAGPNAAGAPWNVGTGVCGNGAFEQASGDDFAFIEAMRTDVEVDQCIDHDHVFVTGFSMGGYFSHQVGCMRPDLARAIAPHSGGTHPFTGCVAGHKPVMIFHGTGDTLIDPNCAKSARDQWVAKNGCGSTVMTVNVKGGHCEWSNGCPADGQVVLCLFDNLAHAWAGGAPNLMYSDPSFESATQLQWDFFKQHAW